MARTRQNQHTRPSKAVPAAPDERLWSAWNVRVADVFEDEHVERLLGILRATEATTDTRRAFAAGLNEAARRYIRRKALARDAGSLKDACRYAEEFYQAAKKLLDVVDAGFGGVFKVGERGDGANALLVEAAHDDDVREVFASLAAGPRESTEEEAEALRMAGIGAQIRLSGVRADAARLLEFAEDVRSIAAGYRTRPGRSPNTTDREFVHALADLADSVGAVDIAPSTDRWSGGDIEGRFIDFVLEACEMMSPDAQPITRANIKKFYYER